MYYPDLVAEIDAQVARIAAQIVCLPPEQLLLRAWREYANITMGISGSEATDETTAKAYRMIDYVQSVIAGAEPSHEYVSKVSDKVWRQLKEEIHSLFMTLSSSYQLCLNAYWVALPTATA